MFKIVLVSGSVICLISTIVYGTLGLIPLSIWSGIGAVVCGIVNCIL